MFIVYLKDTELPRELDFQIGSIQALFKHKMTDDAFWKSLLLWLRELSEVLEVILVSEEPISYAKPLKIKEEKAFPKEGVFISYSHKDKEWLERVLKHLKPIGKLRDINIWDDTLIMPGENWKTEIGESLNSSKVVILIISPDYLASDFILENELPQVLDAAKTKGTVILPIIISPCRYDLLLSISNLQFINDPNKEVLSMLSEAEQGRMLVKLSFAVEEAFKEDRIEDNVKSLRVDR
ncbi:MAG: toll/interleukin-1 receptor domain-containing protein [Promethearchaeota archaeon]